MGGNKRWQQGASKLFFGISADGWVYYWVWVLLFRVGKAGLWESSWQWRYKCSEITSWEEIWEEKGCKRNEKPLTQWY